MPLAVDISKVQVNNFKKSFFDHYLIKEFEEKKVLDIIDM